MPRRINHQSDTSETSDISGNIPKVEAEKNCVCDVPGKMSRVQEFCKNLGMFGFVTAIGVGFIAYSATHVYVCFCAPTGIWGFIQSLVIMDSTFCQTLMGLVHHSQSLYGAMMLAFLLSLIGGISKGVGYMTGTPAPEIPRHVQVRGFQRA
jgi:hypothetical protein